MRVFFFLILEARSTKTRAGKQSILHQKFPISPEGELSTHNFILAVFSLQYCDFDAASIFFDGMWMFYFQFRASINLAGPEIEPSISIVYLLSSLPTGLEFRLNILFVICH